MSAISREHLGAPSVRRRITAQVRRRVPASEVEDIAQTVLCDALASEAAPAEPESLERFVSGITRHKVVDYHRRARRSVPADLSSPTNAPAAEARVLLGRVLDGVSASGRDKQTLGWLVRAHEGEELADIAKEEGVSPEAVRQRVSRLRRALRARWGHVLAFFLVAGSCGALVSRAERVELAIVADPSAAPASDVLSGMQGRWGVEALEIDAAPQEARALLAIEARMTEVEIRGRYVHVASPQRSANLRAAVEPRGDGAFAVTLVDGPKVEHLTLRIERERLFIAFAGGRARLVRR